MSLIKFQNISKHYFMGDQTVRALDGVDIDIEENDYVAFVGSSGSGKSTMMNILGCLDHPTDGEYHLNGQNVEAMSANQLAEIRNKEIGFIFQSFN
jgi:putative ABC transport system ATP-binding protein